MRPAESMPALVGGGLVAAVLAAAVGLGLFDRLDSMSLDLAFAARGARQPAAPILVVTIDEDSFDELQSGWPFARSVYAHAVRRISEEKPMAIGVGLIFSEPSLHGAADDQALADALDATRNVVLANAPLTAGPRASQLPFRQMPSVRYGDVRFPIDDDGAVRRARQTLPDGDRTVPSFAAALYQRAVRAGMSAAPLPSDAEVLINFAGGPRTFPWIPLHRVVSGDLPGNMFRGKIVLIGPTSPILHDVYRTSFARSGGMPGVEIHATILENYLGGTALREMPRWSGVLLTGLAAIASTILVARTGALSALLVTAALCMATVGGAMLALSFRHAWLRGVAPVLAGFVLGLFVSLMAQSIWEERSR